MEEKREKSNMELWAEEEIRIACGDERHPAAVAACGNWVQNGAEAGQMGNAAERRDGGWE